MATNNQAFTPETISQDPVLFFSIPIYQRLFEWDAQQIDQLLDDLYSSYQRDQHSSYYIGMLTAKESGKYKELVDGQQRFTAMMLLGLHFGWSGFLSVSGVSRLQFVARDEDKEYLFRKIKGEVSEYVNEKMEKGLHAIETHLSTSMKLSVREQELFGEYIFKHLTFFLSKLPVEYSSQELNTYFERMNTSGKSLENYEILKVEVIRRLTGDKVLATNLWNATSIMEKKILRKHNNEQLDSLRNRYLKAIIEVNHGQLENAFEKPNARFDADVEDVDDEIIDISGKSDRPSIVDIAANPVNPFKIIKRRSDEHSLLTFPEFLLQVLYICLDCNIDEIEKGGEVIEGINTTDFFDVRKLCATFKWAFDKRGLDADTFIQKLGLYRLLTDYFIIRMNDEDEEPYPFELYIDESNERGKMKVRMYLSMLYSASSSVTYYMWMPELLSYLEDYVILNNNLELRSDDYLKKLKSIDNEWHPETEVVAEQLSYRTIDRYWFWRIDYYLWEQQDLFFPEDLCKVVEKYVFRRNRSIEHIAPQHPSDEYGDNKLFSWDDEAHPEYIVKRDCIGNTVMISSVQNSTLSRSCFEVKYAVMKHYANGVCNGSVESLKMLYVYSRYDRWSIDNIDEHFAFSMKFLHATYEDTSSKWKGFYDENSKCFK